MEELVTVVLFFLLVAVGFFFVACVFFLVVAVVVDFFVRCLLVCAEGAKVNVKQKRSINRRLIYMFKIFPNTSWGSTFLYRPETSVCASHLLSVVILSMEKRMLTSRGLLVA